ncbi:MAG TPA: DUF1573 domain-containing protein [Chitinophagaceae bacterium]|jgi:hypothetical protein
MKKLLVILTLIAAVPVFAQNNAPVEFKEIKHSFGKVEQGKPVTTEFKFTNTSDKAVVIESAVAGCGCTKPEYPETPILKGKTGTIKVTYNAANEGAFTKTVTVKFANVTEPVTLTIDGEVVKKG